MRELSKKVEPCPPGMPPAIWACFNDDAKTLRQLIAQGVDLDDYANQSFNPPIHHALNRMNAEIVKLLIVHGASVHSENFAGYTAVETARKRAQDYCGPVPEKVLKLVEDAAAGGEANF